MKKILLFFSICLCWGQILQATDLEVDISHLTAITTTSANVGIRIQNNTSEDISVTYGVCWSSTNTMPTISDSKISNSGGTAIKKDDYTAGVVDKTTNSITGLTANTVYFLRAYVTTTNSGTTFYGNVRTLKTLKTTASNALNFDGTNDYIAIPDNDSIFDIANGDYSITAWIKPETFSVYGGIVSKSYIMGGISGGSLQLTSIPYFSLRLTGDSPYTGLDIDGKYTTGILSANTWYHVAAVKSGTNRTMYVNGQVYSLSGTLLTANYNSDSLHIGLEGYDNSNGLEHYFDGTIDEVSIWNKALTQSEITSGMNNGFTGTESNLIAYYDFNEGTASGSNTGISTLADASSNNLTGYLRGFARTGSSSNFVAGKHFGSTLINYSISTVSAELISSTLFLTGYFNLQIDNTEGTTESHYYEKGLCWSSTNPTPTCADNKYIDDYNYVNGDYKIANTYGKIQKNFTSLSAGTTYYYRCYCIIDSDTTYANVVAFQTLSSPTVTTTSVNNIDATSATGNGNITNLGNPASLTAYGVCWSSTATTPTISNSKVSNGAKTTTGAFPASITGLTRGTTYYVRAYATNSTGTSYGSVITFQTLTSPIVNSTAVTNITATSATGNGNLSDLGTPDSVTAYGVCYSKIHTTPTISDSSVNNGTTTTTRVFTSSFTGLSQNTTYYLRAYATNASGTAYGDVVSFTTLTLPSVTTQAVTNIVGTTASGNGDITNLGNPDSITAYGVCYSKVNTVPTLSDSSVTNGPTTTTGAFSSSITGLDENTTYYVRAYATNDGGTVYGNTVSFTTLAKPGVTTQAATSVSNTNAIANWSITNLGNSASVSACGVCWSSTNQLPTIADAKIDKGTKSATGAFADTLTGLVKNTTYYVRAYATNAAGTGYGAVVSFTTIPQSFTYTIQNETQTSDRTLEFDLYLLNTDVATPIQIGSVQSCIFVNSAIANGGTITSSIVSGSSGMNSSQQPTAISGITSGNGYYVRIAAKSYPGCGNGTIMNTTFPGTKLCRVRLTNTTAFNTVKANMDFNFTTTPYATKVFYYKSGCSSTTAVQLVTNSINCYSLASNDSLVNISYTTPDSFYTGVPVTALGPTVVGGTITGYSVSPTLPAGLSLDATTGVISGTPTVGGAATNYTITGTYAGGSVTTTVNITVVNVIKELSLRAYLQGFWNSSNMHQCKDENGNAIFSSATDTLSVVLYSSSSPSSIVYQLNGLYLEPDGSIHADGISNINIPASCYGSYYITIKTRNHLETTSASAVSFAGNNISYDFTTAANKAYGSNMIAVSGGYALFVGDVNQDGVINSTDVSLINDQINNFGSGYIPEDTNGDGIMDSSDIDLMESNVNNLVSVIHP